MNKTIGTSFFIASLFLFHSLCYAQISLPKVFGDDMGLQRGHTNTGLGKGKLFESGKAQCTIKFKSILIGDVWRKCFYSAKVQAFATFKKIC